MAYTAYFVMRNFTPKDSYIPYTESYDFWKAMIKKIYQVATDFEIRCWEGEAAAIETGEKFGKRIDNFETKEIVYQGKVTEEFISEILDNYLTEDGRLKWFSIFFKKGDETIFSSEHYGTELIMFHVDAEEIEIVKEYPKQFKEVDDVHIWEENIKE